MLPESRRLQSVIHQQQAEVVRKAVLALPAASRSVLVLREFEGLSYQEIADILEVPVGTVMSRLFAARKNLKKWIENGMLGNVRMEKRPSGLHLKCAQEGKEENPCE